MTDPTPTVIPAPERKVRPTVKRSAVPSRDEIARWVNNPSADSNPFEAPSRDLFESNPWPWDGLL